MFVFFYNAEFNDGDVNDGVVCGDDFSMIWFFDDDVYDDGLYDDDCCDDDFYEDDAYGQRYGYYFEFIL